MATPKTPLSIASAAALFALASFGPASVAFAADTAQAQVAPCYGVNSCKGQSDCKSSTHSCKGQNSCKGQGFKDLTAQECKAQHGSMTEKK
jgi:uncharacterized membrane protein